MDRKMKIWEKLNARAKKSTVFKKLIKETQGVKFAQSSVNDLIKLGNDALKKEKASKIKINEFINKNLTNNKIKKFLNTKETRSSIPLKYNESTINALKKNLKTLDFKDKILLIRKGNDFKAIKDLKDIFNALSTPYDEIREETHGSDVDLILTLKPNDNFGLTFIPKKRSKPTGAYFSYYNNLFNLDLSKYGVLHNGFPKHHCLYEALIQSEIVNHTDLVECKSFGFQRYYKKEDLKNLAKELKIQINLSVSHKGFVHHQYTYNKNSELRQLNLGLIEQHYFLNESMPVSKFFIENFFKLTAKDLLKGKQLKSNGKYISHDPKARMSSFNLIQTLLKLKETHLTKINVLNIDESDTFNPQCDDFILPEFDDQNAEPMVRFVEDNEINRLKEEQNRIDCGKDTDAVFFDFEASTDGLRHMPYLVCDSRCRAFHGDFCARNFLKSFDEDTTLIAHNLRYDLSFIKDELIEVSSLIKSGSRIKSMKGKFWNNDLGKMIEFKFLDSMSFLACKLSDFTEMFKLKAHKDVMPYACYTRYSVKNKLMALSEVKKVLNENDYNQFLSNCRELNIIEGHKFDHHKYAEFYCFKDVELLKQGFNIFRKQIIEISKKADINRPIDICKMVSLPQVANKLLELQGCFDGCFKLNGVYREFISRCIVGGRCMSQNNQKQLIESDVNSLSGYEIFREDLDCNSLYPSAMSRMPGFIKGKPKLLKILSYDFLKTTDYYFVEINITKIGRELKFPLISKKNDKGIRMFENSLGRITVDKVSLEDLIEFQEIEFEIIQGCYFDEGFNKVISSYIRELYETRKFYKSQKNTIQTTYKLLMNAAYGKLIQKAFEDKIKFYNKKDLHKKISWHFRDLKEVVQINDNVYMFKLYVNKFNHFNSCHLGAQVLSMSKRIMNEPMCIVEDHIYYQDTDSMHISNIGRIVLEKMFKEKYGRDLIGDGLGQFSSDFEIKDDELDKSVPIKSTLLIVCGKKSYIDRLEYMTLSGEKKIDYHFRLKGIPSQCVREKCAKDNISLEELYMILYNGQEVPFDLTSCCKFESIKNLDMTTRSKDFIRKIKF